MSPFFVPLLLLLFSLQNSPTCLAAVGTLLVKPLSQSLLRMRTAIAVGTSVLNPKLKQTENVQQQHRQQNDSESGHRPSFSHNILHNANLLPKNARLLASGHSAMLLHSSQQLANYSSTPSKEPSMEMQRARLENTLVMEKQAFHGLKERLKNFKQIFEEPDSGAIDLPPSDRLREYDFWFESLPKENSTQKGVEEEWRSEIEEKNMRKLQKNRERILTDARPIIQRELGEMLATKRVNGLVRSGSLDRDKAVDTYLERFLCQFSPRVLLLKDPENEEILKKLNSQMENSNWNETMAAEWSVFLKKMEAQIEAVNWAETRAKFEALLAWSDRNSFFIQLIAARRKKIVEQWAQMEQLKVQVQMLALAIRVEELARDEANLPGLAQAETEVLRFCNVHLILPALADAALPLVTPRIGAGQSSWMALENIRCQLEMLKNFAGDPSNQRSRGKIYELDEKSANSLKTGTIEAYEEFTGQTLGRPNQSDAIQLSTNNEKNMLQLLGEVFTFWRENLRGTS